MSTTEQSAAPLQRNWSGLLGVAFCGLTLWVGWLQYQVSCADHRLNEENATKQEQRRQEEDKEKKSPLVEVTHEGHTIRASVRYIGPEGFWVTEKVEMDEQDWLDLMRKLGRLPPLPHN
jgi:hypothetical protein